MNYQLIINDFKQYLQIVGYKQGAIAMLLKGANEFTNWLEQHQIYQLEQLTYKDLKAYHDYLSNRPNESRSGGLSSKMVRDYLWAIKLFLEQALRQGKVSKNLMTAYPMPKTEIIKRALLQKSEIKELYAVCETIKERLILDLHYGLGLRRMEVEQLNISDLSEDWNWVQIRKGKGGKGRNLPLINQIQSNIQRYLQVERPATNSDALLINQKGNRQRGASNLRQLKKLLDRTNIDKNIDLHCLRHTIATQLINSGLSLEKLRLWLGHSHLSSTQNYIHHDDQRIFISALSTQDR